MANSMFNAYRNNTGNSTNPDLTTVSIKAMFVDNGFDTAVVGDSFISDILSSSRVPALASCPVLASKTIGPTVGVGVFDAADVVFTALTGASVEQLILLNDTPATEATKDLFCFWDTATGLPLTPNGGDVTVQWSASGIFRF